MEYDDLLVKLGEFGLYQKLMYLIVCLAALPVAFYNLSIVFVAAEPDFWCAVPDADHLLNKSAFDISRDQWLNLTAPRDSLDGEEVHDGCKRYSFDFSTITQENISQILNDGVPDKTIQECSSWQWDTSQYKDSIVTDWDLVCDKAPLVPTVKSLYMAGLMVGVLVFGTVSDAIGRKPVICINLFIQTIIGIVVSFSPNYVTFAILRFFLGVANISVYTTAFVVGVEMVGPSYRVFTGIGIQYFWALGYVLLAGLAYFIRKWVPLQLASSCPWVLLLGILFVIPESPRWLYTQDKKEKADVIVKKMARVNKVVLPEELDIVVKKDPKKAFVWDLLRFRTLRLRTLNIWFLWFVNSMVYYGLTLSSSDLGGNDYINFLIGGAVEFPAYLMCHFTLKHLGRRWPLAICMIIGGLALILTVPVPTDKNWIIVTLAMIGKFCISASFAIVYVFSAEIFPTVVRNVGVGSGSFWARIGGIIAPYAGELDQYGRAIPLILFGALSLAAGVLALFLPETNERTLPATIEDGENFGRKGEKVQDNTGKEAHTNPSYNGDISPTKF